MSGGEVSVTTGEVDAKEVDALLDGIVDDEILDDAEVEDAPGSEELIDPRPATAYLSDDEFKKVGGASLSSPPPASSETKSGSSLFTLQILIRLDESLGLKFPDDTPPKTAEALKVLLLERTWPENAELSRELVAITLTAIDPKRYPERGSWKNGTFQTLLDLLVKGLEEHDSPRCREIAAPLRSSARKRIPVPRRRS